MRDQLDLNELDRQVQFSAKWARIQRRFAAVHADAGAVARQRSDLEGARSHFTRAVELDPHGSPGKRAAKALQELNRQDTEDAEKV